MLQHLFVGCFHFTGLLIVHFHSVEDFSVKINLFFISHLCKHFFLLNIKILLEIFNLIIWRVFKTGWFTCFWFLVSSHNFHDNGDISINHVSWHYGCQFFSFIFFVSFISLGAGAGAGEGAGAGAGNLHDRISLSF